MRNKVKYIDVPVAYDIETTNYRDNGDKASIVYTHTFSVDGEVHILRDWQQFYSEIDYLVEMYDVTPQNRLVIYVHNLAYEFGFIRRYLIWDDVMAIGSTHRIARAVTVQGIEFRCSLLLTNTGLQHVGEEVGVTKMIGDLDYDLMRHPQTALSDEETGYIVNDVQIIIELIRQRMVQDGGIGSIPMTKTGYVRRSVHKATRVSEDYQLQIARMPLTTEDYTMARSAFQGGYVHANATFSGQCIENVTGVDLGSSYPASMIKGLYPMSTFVDVPNPSIQTIFENIGSMKMMVDVTLTGLESRYPFPPISESKTLSSHNTTVDNGRIFTADRVRIIATDIDFLTILRAYEIDQIAVHRVKLAKAGHLPRPLGDAVLGYYGDKTKLKNVADREEDYKLAKENTNSIFGMVATDPVREQYRFDQDLMQMVTVETDIAESIDDHNASKSRFLYYPWACWITAYSRHTLLSAIYDLIDAGITVLYCDTDSIYYVTDDAAEPIIERHNDQITAELTRYFDGGESPDEIEEILSPKTVKGDAKPLGVFELDGVYDRFKALGAKRYATEKEIDGESRFQITVSGLSKRAGDHKDDQGNWVQGYVSAHGGMDFFEDGMTIPADSSGRLIHTYSDELVKNKMVDHNGIVAAVEQWGFVHLEAAEYRLSLSPDYVSFMHQVRGEGRTL